MDESLNNNPNLNNNLNPNILNDNKKTIFYIGLGILGLGLLGLVIFLLKSYNSKKEEKVEEVEEVEGELDEEEVEEEVEEEEVVEDVDCEGEWSECNNLCEREWTSITSPMGNGMVCPESPVCNLGDGDCLCTHDIYNFKNIDNINIEGSIRCPYIVMEGRTLNIRINIGDNVCNENNCNISYVSVTDDSLSGDLIVNEDYLIENEESNIINVDIMTGDNKTLIPGQYILNININNNESSIRVTVRPRVEEAEITQVMVEDVTVPGTESMFDENNEEEENARAEFMAGMDNMFETSGEPVRPVRGRPRPRP